MTRSRVIDVVVRWLSGSHLVHPAFRGPLGTGGTRGSIEVIHETIYERSFLVVMGTRKYVHSTGDCLIKQYKKASN